MRRRSGARAERDDTSVEKRCFNSTRCGTNSTAEQAQIVALLVERVDIAAEGLNARLRIDCLSGLVR